MRVIISGKHLNIGESLKKHVEVSLEHQVAKYFDRAIAAHVTIGKNNNAFGTDIVLNEGTGTKMIIKADGQEYNPYKSVNTAIHKLEHQLRRYKHKLKNHHKKRIEFTDIAPNVYSDIVKGIE
jgi:ribosomal subunit interface protein